MSQTGDRLSKKIEEIASKATEYDTATNFERTKQEYLSDLNSVQKALNRLNRRVERMEFLATILFEVIDADDEEWTRVDDPNEYIEDARRKTRSVIDHDTNSYYQKIDNERTESYIQKVQQTRKTVKKAIDRLEDALREVEQKWQNKINAAREVQKLFGRSTEKTQMYGEIESFVNRRMWDDSESVLGLREKWSKLQDQWEESGTDWGTFQKENNLSDKSVEILQNLAEGKSVQIRQLDENISKELLSVDELHDVVKLTI